MVLAPLHVSIFAIFFTVHLIGLIRLMCFILIRFSCLKFFFFFFGTELMLEVVFEESGTV